MAAKRSSFHGDNFEVTLNDFFLGGMGKRSLEDEEIICKVDQMKECLELSSNEVLKSKLERLSGNSIEEEDNKGDQSEQASLATLKLTSRGISYRRELWKIRQRATICLNELDEQQESGNPEQSVEDLLHDSSIFSCSVYDALDSLGDTASLSPLAATDDEGNDGASCGTSNEANADSLQATIRTLVPAEVPFSILGSPRQIDTYHDCVLTPPLMDALRMRLPSTLRGHNYLLKYSLIRDGASIETLLSKIRTAAHCIIAVETSGDGHVLGSFTSTPWRKSTGEDKFNGWYYGSCEAFLWRLMRPRNGTESSDIAHRAKEADVELTDSDDDDGDDRDRPPPCSAQASSAIHARAGLESDVEVFPWSGENHCVQMSDGRNILAVGGGEPYQDVERRVQAAAGIGGGGIEARDDLPSNRWDMGLALNADLSQGSTGHCATFVTPSAGLLSSPGPPGGGAGVGGEFAPAVSPRSAPPFEISNVDVWNKPFEITNVDVWTLTPMFEAAGAEELEVGRKLNSTLMV